MIYIAAIIIGVVGYLGAAWYAKKINRPYLTWLGSLLMGMLLVSYSFYQTGFKGFGLFAIGVCVVILGVIGSSRYKSSAKN